MLDNILHVLDSDGNTASGDGQRGGDGTELHKIGKWESPRACVFLGCMNEEGSSATLRHCPFIYIQWKANILLKAAQMSSRSSSIYKF